MVLIMERLETDRIEVTIAQQSGREMPGRRRR